MRLNLKTYYKTFDLPFLRTHSTPTQTHDTRHDSRLPRRRGRRTGELARLHRSTTAQKPNITKPTILGSLALLASAHSSKGDQ